MAKRGETKEVILKAATKVFFENGYEDTSVKMIIAEAGIVVGSFYHFFESKEALFEGVVERFIDEYTADIRTILQDDTLSFYDMMDKYVKESLKVNKKYYEMLHGDKLHWSLQYALHGRILNTVVRLFTDMLTSKRDIGEVVCLDNISVNTIAALIVRGIDTMLDETDDSSQIIKYCKKYISINNDVKAPAVKRMAVSTEAQSVKDTIDNKKVKVNVKPKSGNTSKQTAKNGKSKEMVKEKTKDTTKETANKQQTVSNKEIDKEKTKNNIKENKTVKEKFKTNKTEETYRQMSIFEFE